MGGSFRHLTKAGGGNSDILGNSERGQVDLSCAIIVVATKSVAPFLIY